MKECLSNRIKISLNPLKGFLMVILLITIQCNTALSQNKVNFGLFASSVPNKIEVVIKPTYNESGSRYLTNMQFAVKWPVSSGITALVSSPSVPPFNLSAQGLPMSYNGYYYQVFTSIGGNSISWSANQEIVTQTLTYSGLPPFPFFEIAHDNYVKDIINGDYYFEVNGNQTLTGILYSDDAFLPYTWNGSQSSLWTNSANWTPQGIPNDTSSVYIPAATSVHNSPVLSTFTEIKNLKIYSSGRLTLANTGKLTVRNNLENNSDTGIIIKSTATETGSLITLGTMSGNGKAKVELSLTQASGGGVCYHYISSPIANAVMNLFSGYYMYYLKENTNSWVNMTIDSTMKLMNGYAIYKPSMVSDTRTFFGEINNGIIGSSNNVTRADENHGWNLMGNPYPSPIDWDASLGWTKTNVSEAIYFWKEVSKSYAAYVSR